MLLPTPFVADARPCYGQDRAVVAHVGDGLLLAVIDGAGGTGRGAAAADHVCAALRTLVTPPADWCAWLRDRDRDLLRVGGQAAAVVVEVFASGHVRGASVGDCEAHALLVNRDVDLTGRQQRKPLLGDGRAHAVAFEALVRGTLILASDGLWKYARPEWITQATTAGDRVAERLVDCVRLPSGNLQDDVGVIALEIAA